VIYNSIDYYSLLKYYIFGPITDENFGECVVISDNGSIAAISSPGNDNGGVVYIYEIDTESSTWKQKGQVIKSPSDVKNFGKKIGLSSDGIIIVIAGDDKAMVYTYNSDPILDTFETYKKYPFEDIIFSNFTVQNFDRGVAIDGDNLIVYGKDTIGNELAVKLELSCSDDNAAAYNSVSNNPFDAIKCVCNDGYVVSSSSGIRTILEDSEFCVPVLASENIDATHDSIEIKVDPTLGGITQKDVVIMRQDPDALVQIKTEGKFVYNSTNRTVTLNQLRAGFRYNVQLPGVDRTLKLVAVTACNCDDSLVENTGRPQDFRIIQDRGHVMFNFKDNSYCEEAYSFTRASRVEEFLCDISEVAVTFVNDFYFSSSEACGSHISPGKQASDDLSLSKLIVGETYSYCVRAVAVPHYMDAPFALSTERRLTTSSLNACDSHTILYEAAINGLVTTEFTAGNLPIEGVRVEWVLLTADQSEALTCNGCFGDSTTNAGGVFHIKIKVDDDYLKGRNDEEIPIRIKYFKSTFTLDENNNEKEIKHDFLCNMGLDPCNTENGHIEYINHLNFDTAVHIFDTTSIPFSGRIIHSSTRSTEAPDGCPVVEAEVCLLHNTTTAAGLVNLVCVKTDKNGEFVAPVVIGAEVQDVNILYHSHKFEKASGNDYDYKEGIIAQAGTLYNGNDFEDVSHAELIIEVAGGECDFTLGTSVATVKIRGCDWEVEKPQTTYRQKFGRLPAAILEVQITEIKDEAGDRINNIFTAFQDPPIIRSIDLKDVEAEKKEIGDSENGRFEGESGTSRDNQASDNADGALEEEELVRFQYDGVLAMDVEFNKLTATSEDITTTKCYDSKLVDDGTDFDSFHIIDYMTIFRVKIDVYHEIAVDKKCDAVDDKYKVAVISNVGLDDESASGFDKFYSKLDTATKDILKMCSNIAPPNGVAYGPCVYDIVHDDNGRNAAVNTELATGRPRILKPYTKNVVFSIIGGTEEVKHTAVVFVDGMYEEGPGDSFALPTHQPILVIRDPPGGKSYASYKNMVTTAKIVSSSSKISGAGTMRASIGIGFEQKGQACAGGGFGAVVFLCAKATDVKGRVNVPVGAKLNSDFVNKQDTTSNSFSTTWSYQTSSAPARAGAESDIFVVPNLSVMYQEVYLVKWDHIKCIPDQTDEAFEKTVLFDVAATTSQQALSFYSRNHIKAVTVPALTESIIAIKSTLARVSAKEVICCVDGKGSCLGKGEDVPLRECDANDVSHESKRKETLENANDGWGKFLKKEEVELAAAISASTTITNWFDNSALDQVTSDFDNKPSSNDKADAKISDSHTKKTALAPKQLIDKAEMLESAEDLIGGTNDRGIDKIRKTRRIQFAGGSGMYTMSLNQNAMRQFQSQNCDVTGPLKVIGGIAGGAAAVGSLFSMGAGVVALPIAAAAAVVGSAAVGCNYALDLSTSFLDGTTSANIFGAAVDASVGFDVQLHIEHTSVVGQSANQDTSISYALGDPDAGDEVVVDIYHDRVFNTFAFNTIAGKTRCYHEKNTKAGEEPFIEVTSTPSQFIFPDEDIVFDFTIAHNGDHVYSSYLLFQNGNDDGGYLQAILDTGYPLDANGKEVQLYKGEIYKRQIKVRRDPQRFDFAPVNLVLKSKCEGSKSMSVPLYNFIASDGATFLKWLEPCPPIKFAGELKRDQSFLVNLQSEDPKSLTVTIYNPNASKPNSTLKDMKEPDGRLKNANLVYRKAGEVTWNIAKNITNDDIDYSLDSVDEDNFGYSTLKWNIEDLSDGTYEIVVQTECSDVGGPDEFNFARDEIITGVIDLVAPEQYGEVVPLREDVIVGEEMVVVFTEPLDCTLPLSFDVQVTVNKLEIVLKKDDLLVICEGRKIGIQLDLSVGIEPSQLIGEQFTVELGKVGDGSKGSIKDIHGNPMDPLKNSIKFSRQFGDLDLSSATTLLLINRALLDNTCDNFALEHLHLEAEITSELVSTIGLQNEEAIVVRDLYCQSMNTVGATVVIQAKDDNELGTRRLLGNASGDVTTFDVYRKLQDILTGKLSDANGRRLVSSKPKIVAHSVRIIPHERDMAKFVTSTADRGKEDLMYHIASPSEGIAASDDEVLKKLEKYEAELENGFTDNLNKEKESYFFALEERLNKQRDMEIAVLNKQRDMEIAVLNKQRDMEIAVLKREQSLEFEVLEKRFLEGKSNSVVDLKEMFMLQGIAVLIGCSVATIALYFVFTGRHASNAAS